MKFPVDSPKALSDQGFKIHQLRENPRLGNACSIQLSYAVTPALIKYTATPFSAIRSAYFTGIYSDLLEFTEWTVGKTRGSRFCFSLQNTFQIQNIIENALGGSMAKRFTDTKKWDDDWYLSLPPKLKCAWDYLCDNCDGAGVLKVSLSLMSFRIGESITRDEMDRAFKDRVVWLGPDKIWLSGFITFQYKTLSPNNKAHRGIMAMVIRQIDGLPLNDPQMTLINGWKESLATHNRGRKEKDNYNYNKGGVGENTKPTVVNPNHNATLRHELSYRTDDLDEIKAGLDQIFGKEIVRRDQIALGILTACKGDLDKAKAELEDIFAIPEVRGKGIDKTKRTAYASKVLKERFGI